MSGISGQIALLSRWLEGTDIEFLELTTAAGAIRLRNDTPQRIAASSVPANTSSSPIDIPASSVGIFRRTHPARTSPIVRAGQRLKAGDPVGLLQIGSLLVHVAAPKDGTVLAVLAEDGATVGYGTALVRLMESGEQ